MKTVKSIMRKAVGHLMYWSSVCPAARVMRTFGPQAFVTENEHHTDLKKFYSQVELLQSPEDYEKVDFRMLHSVKAS
jgi:hypothetical protein